MSVSIRPARPEERDGLSRIKRNASLAESDQAEALLRLPGAFAIDRLEQTFVAERAGALIGFAAAAPADEGDWEIEDLFVEPAHWRQGVGALLVREAVRRAAAAGARRVKVIAGARARPFYEAQGFRMTGSVMTELEPAFALCMTLCADGERSCDHTEPCGRGSML